MPPFIKGFEIQKIKFRTLTFTVRRIPCASEEICIADMSVNLLLSCSESPEGENLRETEVTLFHSWEAKWFLFSVKSKEIMSYFWNLKMVEKAKNIKTL